MLKGQELKAILIDSKAKVFITHNACFETLTGYQKDLNLLRESVLFDEVEGKEGLVPLEKLKEKGSHKFSAICMDPDDPGAITYASGTTGMPKGAVFTHDNLSECAKALNFLFGNLKPNDRILNVAPLSSSLTIAGVVITDNRFLAWCEHLPT